MRFPTHAQSATIPQRSADDFITPVGKLFVKVTIEVRTRVSQQDGEVR